MMSPDGEQVIGLQPDAIFVTGMSKASGDDPFKVVADAGICIIYIPSSSSYHASFNLLGITFERAGELHATSEYNSFKGMNVMVIYKNDSEKLEIEIPLMFNKLPAETRNLAFVINCEARITGAIIYYLERIL